jgi:hypothetical protein
MVVAAGVAAFPSGFWFGWLAGARVAALFVFPPSLLLPCRRRHDYAGRPFQKRNARPGSAGGLECGPRVLRFSQDRFLASHCFGIFGPGISSILFTIASAVLSAWLWSDFG